MLLRRIVVHRGIEVTLVRDVQREGHQVDIPAERDLFKCAPDGVDLQDSGLVINLDPRGVRTSERPDGQDRQHDEGNPQRDLGTESADGPPTAEPVSQRLHEHLHDSRSSLRSLFVCIFHIEFRTRDVVGEPTAQQPPLLASSCLPVPDAALRSRDGPAPRILVPTLSSAPAPALFIHTNAHAGISTIAHTHRGRHSRTRSTVAPSISFEKVDLVALVHLGLPRRAYMGEIRRGTATTGPPKEAVAQKCELEPAPEKPPPPE